MRITDGGLVGINTTPATGIRLDVSGSIRGTRSIVARWTSRFTTPTNYAQNTTNNVCSISFVPVQSGSVTVVISSAFQAFINSGTGIDRFFMRISDGTTLQTFTGGYFNNTLDALNRAEPYPTHLGFIDVVTGAKTYNHDDVAEELNGNYTKDEFNAIRDSNPTDEFQKFCRIYYIMKKSVMSLGAGWNQTRKKMIVQLQGFKERLEDVIIYNTDYKELILKYDSDETFFYLDPPYEKSDGLYKHHIINMNEMYSLLSNIKGKFLMSYNDSEVVREIFKDFNIYEVETNYLGGIVNKSIRPITELLISNYKCV
jgi:hypothetical protein